MSRRRGKSLSTQRFVALPHYLLNSPAFESLPGDAVKILIGIWKRHNGANNGQISFGVREAAEIGISKSVASRMMNMLIERGFLVVVRQSHFSLKSKLTRTWKITGEPYRDEKATNDFMRWKPDRPAEKAAHGPSTGTENSTNQSLHRDRGKKILGPSTGTHGPSTGTRVIKLPEWVPPQGPSGEKTGSHGPSTGTLIHSHAVSELEGAPHATARCTPAPCPRTPGCVLLELAGEA